MPVPPPLQVGETTTYHARVRLLIPAVSAPLTPSRHAIIIWRKTLFPLPRATNRDRPTRHQSFQIWKQPSGQDQHVCIETYFMAQSNAFPIIWSDLISARPDTPPKRRDIVRSFWEEMLIWNCIARNEFQVEMGVAFLGVHYGARGLPIGLGLDIEPRVPLLTSS